MHNSLLLIVMSGLSLGVRQAVLVPVVPLLITNQSVTSVMRAALTNYHKLGG